MPHANSACVCVYKRFDGGHEGGTWVSVRVRRGHAARRLIYDGVHPSGAARDRCESVRITLRSGRSRLRFAGMTGKCDEKKMKKKKKIRSCRQRKHDFRTTNVYINGGDYYSFVRSRAHVRIKII